MPNNHSTTSLNTMPFNENFETEVNNNMNPNRNSTSKDLKAPMPVGSPDPSEATDNEFNEKMAMKDQTQPPPRFSTIFDTKAPAATPAREFESYPQHPVRKSGVYIPTPLFWAILAIFLFESAALFAYTVIGLVSNMSSKLVHTNGAGAVVAGCDCNSQPINISPNFFMPNAPQAPVVETTTLSTTLSTSTSTASTTSSSSSSSQSINAGVSNLVDILKSISTATTSESSTSTPNTRVVTVTPPGSTVKSTTILTVDSSGSTIAPRPTVTSTKIVAPDEPSATLETRDETTSIVSTTTAAELTPLIVPFTTNEGSGGIVVSVSMAPVTASPSTVPTISLTLQSHNEFANTPTQESEVVPPSTTVASSEPSEIVSPSSTIASEPSSTCTKSNHMWGASGRIWGGTVCK